MAAFKKYLLYGFGAVALMFIGILLNLQITNWNDARKAAADDQANTKINANPFVGSWLLDSVSQLDSAGESKVTEVFKDGLIIYSADGYMSAVLTYTDNHVDNPGLDAGYCGKYEFNQEESYVSHLRDVIAINNNTENEVFVRDYLFSDDGKYLTLSPREAKWKGTSLTWKKVD